MHWREICVTAFQSSHRLSHGDIEGLALSGASVTVSVYPELLQIQNCKVQLRLQPKKVDLSCVTAIGGG